MYTFPLLGNYRRFFLVITAVIAIFCGTVTVSLSIMYSAGFQQVNTCIANLLALSYRLTLSSGKVHIDLTGGIWCLRETLRGGAGRGRGTNYMTIDYTVPLLGYNQLIQWMFYY